MGIDTSNTLVPVRDGRVGLHTVGNGPGLVIVHGSAVRASDYRRFTEALSHRYTVHIYDRRGRATSSAACDPYSIAAEIDDLAAVLTFTEASNVFGHSYGGYIALAAAHRLQPANVAVYDPAVSISGGFPTEFIEPFAEAVGRRDHSRAFGLLNRGLGTTGALSRLPPTAQAGLGGLFLRTPMGRRWADLLPTVVAETRAVRDGDAATEAYSMITAETALFHGGRSPRYFGSSCEELASCLPNARSYSIRGAGHDAPNRADRRLIAALVRFFSPESR